MDKILESSLLFDFYGDLLNEHQRDIYENFLLNDLSLAEIADEQGITRQGVHETVRRCEKKLKDYENKLKLVEKFLSVKDKVGRINECAEALRSLKTGSGFIDEINRLSSEILDEL